MCNCIIIYLSVFIAINFLNAAATIEILFAEFQHMTVRYAVAMHELLRRARAFN